MRGRCQFWCQKVLGVLRKNSVQAMPPLVGDRIRDEVPPGSMWRQFAHWLVVDVVVPFGEAE